MSENGIKTNSKAAESVSKNKRTGKLAFKTLVPLGGIIVFLIGSIIATYVQVKNVQAEIRELKSEKVAAMELAESIRYYVLNTSEIFTDMSAVKDQDGMEEAAEIRENILSSIDELVKIVPQEKNYWDAIKAEYELFYSTCNRMKDAYINEGQEAGNAIMEEVDPITERLSEEVEEYSTKTINEMDEYILTIDDSASTILVIFIVSSLLVLALVSVTTVIILRQVITPIKTVTDSINELASHNLGAELLKINNNDEIGVLADSNNKLRTSLRTIISELNASTASMGEHSGNMSESASAVSSSMTDIAHSVTEIAENAGDQAAGVERTTSELHNLQTIIQANENASRSLADASEKISQASTEGAQVIEDLYNTTKSSEAAFSAIFDSIEKIIESTQHIKKASNMIEDIAAQTNLLSLNASIEAARAGDMGRGFAVVADEIRTLSDGSRQSVGEINRILAELEANVDLASKQSDTIKQAVEKQVAGVETTREKYNNISQNVVTINSEITELGDVSKSLTSSCNVVGEIMSNLSAMAEENAASTEETTASVEEAVAMIQRIENGSVGVKELAEKLQELVAIYKL